MLAIPGSAASFPVSAILNVQIPTTAAVNGTCPQLDLYLVALVGTVYTFTDANHTPLFTTNGYFCSQSKQFADISLPNAGY